MSSSGSRRGLTALFLGCASVAIAALFFWAGTQLQSGVSLPGRVIEPIPTVELRRGRLIDTIELPAKVVSGPTEDVTPLAPQLGPGVTPLVTRTPLKDGRVVGDGSLLFEVAGVPTFAMPGTTPMYRPLTVGDTGPDVAQLQRGLQELGYYIDDPTGQFGASTGYAVAEFFQARGYVVTEAPGGAALHGRRRLADRAPVVEAANIVFIPALPAYVVTMKLTLGGRISGVAMSLASGRPSLVATGGPEQLATIAPGMKAIVAGAGFRRSAGIVSSVRANGAVIRTTVPPPSIGTPLVVEIVRARSPRPVWEAPASAVQTSPAGQTSLIVTGNHMTNVPVRVGPTVAGLVAVSPLNGNRFYAGERIAAVAP